MSEKELLPRFCAARFFDTVASGATPVKTPERIACGYELSLYTDSRGTVFTNGRAHPIQKGDIRFSRPGDRVCSVPHFTCYTLRFDLPKGSDCALVQSIPEYFSGRFFDAYADFMKRIVALGAALDEVGAPASVNAQILELLVFLYRDASAGSDGPQVVEAAKEYLERCFSSKISLENLGATFGYNPFYFLRIFRAQTGCSPHEYLTQIRMKHARTLLLSTNLTVYEIAERCGYQSVSHFSDSFKRRHGASPYDYRRSGEWL